MTDLTAAQVLRAGAYGAIAIAWGTVAAEALAFGRRWHRDAATWMVFGLGALGATFYGGNTIVQLVPPEVLPKSPPAPISVWLMVLFVVMDWSQIFLVATARHAARYWGYRREAPSRRWLAVNYGAAIPIAFLTLTFPAVLAPFPRPLVLYITIRNLYTTVFLALLVADIMGIARAGRWLPGAGAGIVRRRDVLLFGAALIAIALVASGIFAWGLPGLTSPLGFTIDFSVGLLATTPLAVRILGPVMRNVLVTGAVVALTAIALQAARGLTQQFPALGLARTAEAIAVLVVAAVVGPARDLLATVIARIGLRRRTALWGELRHSLLALGPERGVAECSRRALGILVEGLRLPGAAIVLRDGEALAAGDFALEPLRRVWLGETPRGGSPLLLAESFRALSPQAMEALADTAVAAVVVIASPRRQWGHLFLRTGLGQPVREDAEAVEAFTAQLGLLLDAADLLERTVAVERSLAHAEKLAAIGELAARIAHEIRNPVTAARSLAQLLASDPTAPENTEHAGLILGELERVERQVRELLRFARREDYRLEPVDLGEVAAHALQPARPRLDAARVAVALEVAPGVVVRADREHLRQVVVNLIENALDALAETSAERRLEVAVTRRDGRGVLHVRDTGPGIPPDALARVFEPFFSKKANGTGLGLAIARRTVEAFGGRIVAESDRSGASFRVDLPVAS